MTGRSGYPLRLPPSPGSLLAFLAIIIAVGPGLPQMFSSDGDVGRHISVGRQILAARAIPATDTLSHTRYGEEWVPKEWLAQVTFAEVDQLNGLAGAATLAAILFAFSVWMTFTNARFLGGSLFASMAVAATSMLLQTVHLLPRPHLFTTAFVAALLFLLIQFRRTGRLGWVAGVPVLLLVWTNLHGGFPVGLALIGIFSLDALLSRRGPNLTTQRRALPLVGALSALATLINPAGPTVWSHVIGHLGSDFLMGITEEFRSPDFHAPWSRILLLTIVGLGILLGSGRFRFPFLGLGLLIGTLAATLVSVRYIALFAVLGLPWLAAGQDSRRGPGSPDHSTAVWPLRSPSPGLADLGKSTGPILSIVGILALLWVANGPMASRATFSPKVFPVDIMSGAGSRQSGKLFNEMEWGGYLLYEYPGTKIFLDGHADFFGEELVREYMTVRQGYAGWADILDRYGVDWTLTRRTAPLNQLLELSPEWEIVERDEVSALFRRTDE